MCYVFFMQYENMTDLQKSTILMFEENGYSADLQEDDAEIIFASKKIVTSSGFTVYVRIFTNVFTDEESCVHIYDVSEYVDTEQARSSFSLQLMIKTKNDLDLFHAITDLFFLFLKKEGMKITVDSNDQFIVINKKGVMEMHLKLSFKEKSIFFRKNWANSNKYKVSFKRLINEDPLVIYNEIVNA